MAAVCSPLPHTHSIALPRRWCPWPLASLCVPLPWDIPAPHTVPEPVLSLDSFRNLLASGGGDAKGRVWQLPDGADTGAVHSAECSSMPCSF